MVTEDPVDTNAGKRSTLRLFHYYYLHSVCGSHTKEQKFHKKDSIPANETTNAIKTLHLSYPLYSNP